MLLQNAIEVTLGDNDSALLLEIATQSLSSPETSSAATGGAASLLDQLPILPLIGQLNSLPDVILQQVVQAYDQVLADSPELILDLSNLFLRLPPVDFENPLTLDALPGSGAYSQVVAFGDSLTDTGNLSGQLANFGVTFPPLPYAPGRLSDGPLWIEYFADDLATAGLLGSPTPVNNAILGSTSGRSNVTANVIADSGSQIPPALAPIVNQLPGIQDQVDLFTNTVGALDPNALYVVWGGANDFRNLPTAPIAAVNAVLDAVENIIDSVIVLAESGAQQIAVINLPNLGLTPLATDLALVSEATAFSTGFNLLLQGSLGALEPQLGVDLIQVDTFSLVQAIAQRPSEFGFTNITDPLIEVLAAGGTPNPSEFAFMDGFHPTTAFHRLVADAVGQAVIQPTPGAVLPTSLGLASSFLEGIENPILTQLVNLLLPSDIPEPSVVVEPDLPTQPVMEPELPLMPTDSISIKLYGTHQSEVLEGNHENNYLYGNGGADTLMGGLGNDYIYGSDAAEVIMSDSGDDVIYSNGGMDLIDSGSGLDEVWLAGASDATVKLTVGDGYDTIVNYQAGATRLSVTRLNDISIADGSAGLELWQSGDLLAVIAHQTKASFNMGSLLSA